MKDGGKLSTAFVFSSYYKVLTIKNKLTCIHGKWRMYHEFHIHLGSYVYHRTLFGNDRSYSNLLPHRMLTTPFVESVEIKRKRMELNAMGKYRNQNLGRIMFLKVILIQCYKFILLAKGSESLFLSWLRYFCRSQETFSFDF